MVFDRVKMAGMYTLLTLQMVVADDLSCNGRCGLVTPGASCQCTSWCVRFGGCCVDYHFICNGKAAKVQPSFFTLPKTTEPPTTEPPTTLPPTTVTATTITVTKTSTTLSTTTITTTPKWQSVSIGSAILKGSPQCQAFGPEKLQIQVGDQLRSMTMFLPGGVQDAPLWLVLHGSKNTVDYFLQYTDLSNFAQANQFGFLALQASRIRGSGNSYQFDVGAHSQPMEVMEDAEIHDVQFVRDALRKVLKLPCINKRRVHCAGYSNGARFCMRLAAEMSMVFASVAPVSGLRFPKPNLANRPIPILAFHGEADKVNPFKGHGDTYWHESVPDAMKDWAQFNQCSGSFAAPKFLQHAAFLKGSYTGCKDNATVEVIRMPNAGRQWPGATFTIPGGLRKLKSLHSHFGVAFLGYPPVPWNRQRRSGSAMRQWQC